MVVRSGVGVDGVEPGGGDSEDNVDGGGDRLDVSENDAIPSSDFPFAKLVFLPLFSLVGRGSVGDNAGRSLRFRAGDGEEGAETRA